MKTIQFTAKVTGKGHGMRLLPFPDKRRYEVIALSVDAKTRTATLECVKKG